MGESPHTRPTSEFHARNFSTADVGRLVAGLDAQDGADGVRRLRAWAQSALDPRPGEQVIDVGSGTGSQTLALAAAVGATGDTVGIEANPALREVAEQRAAEAGSTARFLDGDALALPLPDATVDVVWCERVLQHLSEPDKAVGEIARVLRPGGRVVLIDSDWATALLHPGDPDAVAALMREPWPRPPTRTPDVGSRTSCPPRGWSSTTSARRRCSRTTRRCPGPSFA